MSDLEQAIQLAARAHAGQRDKAGMPYILHPLRLMLQCDDLTTRIVAVLHDVIEDTEIDINDLRRMDFPLDAIDAIDCLTKRPGEHYDDFISRILCNPIARKVKELDLIDNLDCTRLIEISENDCDRLKKYSIALRRIRIAIIEEADLTPKPSSLEPALPTSP